MIGIREPFVVAGLLLALAQAPPPFQADPPIACDDCAAWNAPREPSRIFGNTYSVGTAGLSAILIVTGDGLILLDGGLPQTAPLIAQAIGTLGFRLGDVRLILNSHAHFDHAGGIAALQRASGATVAASPAGARALERGEPLPDDPQFDLRPEAKRFPAVPRVRVVQDGDMLSLGDVAVTAHLTPGHTPGSTSWTWRSCEGARCRDVAYADSLTAVSAPGFRFTGAAGRPDRVAEFRRSITAVAALPCDLLLAPHPQAAAGKTCTEYADAAARRLDERVRQEEQGR